MNDTYTLTNWTLCRQTEGRHAGRVVLMGSVSGRLGVRDGDPIRTNTIVGFEGERGGPQVALTASGSRYELVGPACADFHAWWAAQEVGFRLATPNFEVVGEAGVTEVE